MIDNIVREWQPLITEREIWFCIIIAVLVVIAIRMWNRYDK